jgi:hypothetical protein
MSIAAAERGLLPRIRTTPTDTLVLANGFNAPNATRCIWRR